MDVDKLFDSFLAKHHLESNKVCACGISIKEVVESGKLGCSKCYKTFGEFLKSFIEQLNYKHQGKRPKIKNEDAIKILEQEMIKAAFDGRFNDAKILKDDIKRLRG